MELLQLSETTNYHNIKSIQSNRIVHKSKNIMNIIEFLKNRILPENVIELINNEIELINNFLGEEKYLLRQFRKSQNKILKIIEKELKIYPKNYHQNLWMALGISLFGFPIGVAVSHFTDQPAFIGGFMPIGMVIGMFIGYNFDKKVKAEGNQLNFDLK